MFWFNKNKIDKKLLEHCRNDEHFTEFIQTVIFDIDCLIRKETSFHWWTIPVHMPSDIVLHELKKHRPRKNIKLTVSGDSLEQQRVEMYDPRPHEMWKYGA